MHYIVYLSVLCYTDPIAIDPPIENRNISSYEVGEVASIGCPVSTCKDNVRVVLMKGEELVAEGMITGTPMQRVYNFLLEVDYNTPGTYVCKADIEGFSAQQEFNITGKRHYYIQVVLLLAKTIHHSNEV